MNKQSRIRPAVETMEGAGATVKRLMPVPGFMNFDPFVLWDHFYVGAGAGFPDHPHRGFEAITYMFEGSMNHKDNLGNESTVMVGGAQRFTAGSGLVHSEMPGATGNSTGIQLWINLPVRFKPHLLISRWTQTTFLNMPLIMGTCVLSWVMIRRLNY